MLYPKANKTSLAKLVKAKGYTLPPISKMQFSSMGKPFFLRWNDPSGEQHVAYYTGAGGRPVLQVDKTWHKLTPAEVRQYDLAEEK